MSRSRLRRRLAAVEAIPPPVPTPFYAPPSEAGDLAREMGEALARAIQHHRQYYQLTPEEARSRAHESNAAHINFALTSPPDQVTWDDLGAIAEQDASQAQRRWEEIKQAARAELGSGHRAARAIEDAGGLWERARFAAVRTALMEVWRPRNAFEQQLVDQLAQWQMLLWRWQETLSTWTSYATHGARRVKKGEPRETMRVSEAEALERAAEMVERLHRLYLRTLKALQDLRRVRAPVVVRRAGQVNIAHQQVNVAGACVAPDSERNGSSTGGMLHTEAQDGSSVNPSDLAASVKALGRRATGTELLQEVQ